MSHTRLGYEPQDPDTIATYERFIVDAAEEVHSWDEGNKDPEWSAPVPQYLKDRAEWTREQYDQHVAEIRREWDDHIRREYHRKRDRMCKAGIPVVVVDDLLQSAGRDTKATRAIADMVKRGDWLLVLAGKPGLGKSFAAASWLARDPARCSGRFIVADDLNRINRYKSESWNPVAGASELVIDDIGLEYLDDKGNFGATFDSLANHRFANKLPTVMTTNLTITDFVARYKTRIIDRLAQSGGYHELTGESLRKRGERREAPPLPEHAPSPFSYDLDLS